MSGDNAASGISAMKPLDGVRILDLATFIAAPFAATVMAEFGAEVIKVEHPTGDPMRRFGTVTEAEGQTLAWLSEARNKKSVTLDLKTPEGVRVIKELVKRSDILAENFRPGTLEKWGLGPDVLMAINPKLVMLRVTGYGQTGPYKDRPGFARIAHAVGGLTYLAGEPGGAPVTPGSTSLADYISGFYGTIGLLMALRVAEKTGKGQIVDIALYESIFRVLDEIAPLYAKHGVVREREGRNTLNACPHGHFPCSDGNWVAVACTSDKMWERMAANVLKRPELAESHPTTRSRLDDRDVIDGVVEAFTTSMPMKDVVAACTAGDVPCGAVNSIADIFKDPHFEAREVLTHFQHEALGDVVVPSVLPRLTETPGSINELGPPLGSANDYVLKQLIEDDEELRI